MADIIRVRRNDRNEYWVHIQIEGHLLDALIDTGMTSPDCSIGVGLDEESYQKVKPHLRRLRRIELEGVGASSPDLVVGGLGRVSIHGLDDSEVETYIAEAGDNLIGVCYFQRLRGYEVVWDLEHGILVIRKKAR